MFRRIVGSAAVAAALVSGAIIAAPQASAGCSCSDWYYGTKYSQKVGTFYIQATNYDNNAGGQTYHFAMKGLPAGYTPSHWTFNGVRDFSGYYGGYKNYSDKVPDHTIVGYAKNSAGNVYYATIYSSVWR